MGCGPHVHFHGQATTQDLPGETAAGSGTDKSQTGCSGGVQQQFCAVRTAVRQSQGRVRSGEADDPHHVRKVHAERPHSIFCDFRKAWSDKGAFRLLQDETAAQAGLVGRHSRRSQGRDQFDYRGRSSGSSQGRRIYPSRQERRDRRAQGAAARLEVVSGQTGTVHQGKDRYKESPCRLQQGVRILFRGLEVQYRRCSGLLHQETDPDDRGEIYN